MLTSLRGIAVRSTWVTGALALALAGGLWAGSPSANAAQRATAATAIAAVPPGVPVLGQAMGRVTSRPNTYETVISLHAVQRVPNGTVVYFSLGASKAPADMDWSSLSASMGDVPNMTAPKNPRDREGSVGIVDPKNKQIYFPYAEAANCYSCNWVLSIEGRAKPREAYVFSFTTPQVPEGVDKVAVRVGTAVFLDVPVGEGLLEPTEQETNKAPLIGVTWPKIDLSRIASLKPADFTSPLTETTVEEKVTVREEPEEVNVDLNSSVLFDVDQAVVKPAGQAAVADAAARIKAAKKDSAALTVTGHTDSDGDDAHNLDLSQRRAEAVAALLRSALPNAQITTEGKGESEPIASNETDSGKQLNRRVTITFGGQS
jgi:outer membrane protein OmpA-like peptidoglycan-associated protein